VGASKNMTGAEQSTHLFYVVLSCVSVSLDVDLNEREYVGVSISSF